MSEGFAAQDQCLSGLFCFVHLISRCLGVLHLSQLHVFTDTVKLLFSVLELANIPEDDVEILSDTKIPHIYSWGVLDWILTL